MKTAVHHLLVALVLGLLVLGLGGAPAGAADADSPVDAGRDALQRTGDYNWYDEADDDLRRIEVKPPKPPSQPTGTSNFNFNIFAGGDWFTPLAWMAITLLLGTLVYFLVRAYLVRERGVAQQAEQDREDDVQREVNRVEQLPVRLRTPQSDLLAEARRHYEEGNYREAVIYLYSHQLVQLDRGNLIRLTRGKTNRQYLGEVASRSGLRRLLADTMEVFESVFFGKHPLDRPKFETIWDRLDEFDALLEKAEA